MAGRAFALAASTALALLAIAVAAAPAAATAAIQLDVSPATIQLAPDEKKELLLIVRNPTASSLQNLRLRVSSVADVDVKGEPPANAQVEAGGSLSFPVTVTQTASGRPTGVVYFELLFVRHPANAAPVPEVAVASAEIQERAADTVDKLATLRIETETVELDDHHAGELYLIVTNIAAVPVTVTGMSSEHPKFINVELPKVDKPIVLAPQTTCVFPAKISVSSQAPSGKRRMVFTVAVAWKKSGRDGLGTLVAAHTVNVGVFGESQLLQLVGVPSLLFLPGFLMLSSFLLLWVRVWPQKAQTLSASEFTLISVTLSLLAALAYPVLTRHFGGERDYLRGYGLQDIFQVWFGSVFAGASAWLLLTVGVQAWRRVKALQAARAAAQANAETLRRTPDRNDQPLDILEKMVLNNVTFPLEQVDVTRNGQQRRYFVAMPRAAEDAQVWVIPPIIVTVQSGAEDWIKRLEDAAKAGPAQLQDAARSAAPMVDFGWGAAGGPMPVDANEIKVPSQPTPRLIIEF